MMVPDANSTTWRECWLNHNSCRRIHQLFKAQYRGFQSAALGMRLEGFCRPVSRVLYPPRKGKVVIIYLAQTPVVKPAYVRFWRNDVTVAVKRPTRGLARRLCPPIWPCSRWGLATVASPQTVGRSYRPISPLSF